MMPTTPWSLYRGDVDAAFEEGALTHKILAHSREPGQPKQYVQDLIPAQVGATRPAFARASAAVLTMTIFAWCLGCDVTNAVIASLTDVVYCALQADWLKDVLLNDKAHVYVCGDSQMSAGVSAAIGQIIGGFHWLQHACTQGKKTVSTRS